MRLRYRVVDVFTQTPLEGNPLAVFPDAGALDTSTMQRIARELNLSETTFILPAARADSAAHVRIFTTTYEMTFAGHPTIGTAYIMLDEGIVAAATRRFVIEEKVGLVPIRLDDGPEPLIWLETPPIAWGDAYDAGLSARAVGLAFDDLLPDVPCRRLSAGNPTVYIAVRDTATVDRARVDSAALRELLGAASEPSCVFVFAPVATGAYSRMFAEELGVVEDPATGSATGPLAAFMMAYGLIARTDGTRFVSEQGTKMGRRSRLHVLIRGESGATAIEVGGHVVPVAQAVMTLPDPA